LICRDLKLQNVLIDGDGHCRVGDFGLSNLGVFKESKVKDDVGTPHYKAPEVIIAFF
jgi:serine/threonine protein kinase